MLLSHFNSEEWNRLTASDRIKQCRNMREEARGLAAQANGEIKVAYLEIAQSWEHLAHEIEAANSKQAT